MEIVLCRINDSDISYSKLEKYLPKIDKLKQVQIKKYRNDQDKIRSLVAHLIVYNFFGGNINYQYNNGKAYNINDDVYFSISHSGDYVAVAFSEHEIGIDIERIGLIDNSMKDMFCSKIDLDNFNDPTEVWCLKESYFKKNGIGSFNDLRKTRFSKKNDKIICLDDDKTHFNTFIIDKNYMCAVACNENSEINLNYINVADIIKEC